MKWTCAILFTLEVDRMNSDLFKIIEGGMQKDTQKVINYSKRLAEEYNEQGKTSTARKIEKIITENNTRLSTLDSLTSKPIDKDTKVDLIDVVVPFEEDETLFFNTIVENEIRDFILSYDARHKLSDRGIPTTNNLLLYGPPGTGKSSLAKYISLQLNLPLLTVRMDGVISSLLGSTAKNIRKVFDYASKQPCILFLDEFDVIAKVRDDRTEIGELKRVVNSLIQNIDSFSEDSILIAATNHSQLLDSAVWRRFDRVLLLDFPDEEIRRDLVVEFSKIMENNFTNDRKKLEILVSVTEGLSPSQLKTIIMNVAKKSIVDSSECMKFSHLLYEIFIFRHTTVVDDELINFLNSNGVSQREIYTEFGIPVRKIQTALIK